MPIAFGRNLGTGAINSSGTTVVITTTDVANVGEWIVVRVAADNLSISTPTFVCADSAGNTYAVDIQDARVATAGAGIAGGVLSAPVTTQLPAGGTITVTLSGATFAKAAVAQAFTGVEGRRASGTAVALGVSTTPSVTLTTPESGDLVIGHIAHESMTAPSGYGTDASNGSWSTGAVHPSSTTGTDNQRVEVIYQHKIVTGTGSQTFDATVVSSDWIAFEVAYTPAADAPDQRKRSRGEILRDWVLRYPFRVADTGIHLPVKSQVYGDNDATETTVWNDFFFPEPWTGPSIRDVSPSSFDMDAEVHAWGANYDFASVNSRVYLSQTPTVPTTQFVRLGTGTGLVRCPDTAGLAISDNIDIMVRVEPEFWNKDVVQGMVGLRAGLNDDWEFRTSTTSRTLNFVWWGTDLVAHSHSATVPHPLPDHRPAWVRVRRSGTTITFWYSEDDTNDYTLVTWVQLGALVTTVAGAINNQSTEITVGAANTVFGEPCGGDYYRVVILNDTTPVYDAKFYDQTQWTEGEDDADTATDAYGNVLEIDGTVAEIVVPGAIYDASAWDADDVYFDLSTLTPAQLDDLSEKVGPGPRYVVVKNGTTGLIDAYPVALHRVKALWLEPSSWVSAPYPPTQARLIPPNGKTDADFGGGVLDDNNNPQSDAVDLAANEYREDEWSIAAGDGADDYHAYEFRVYAGDSPPTELYVHPQITVIPYADDPAPPPSTGPTDALMQLLKDDEPYVVTGGVAWGRNFLYPVTQEVVAGLTPVSKDVSLRWDDQAALGDTNTLRWDLFTKTFDTAALLWDIHIPVADTITARWDIRTSVFDTTTYLWDIRTPVFDTATFRWDQFTKIFDTTGLLWDIRAALGDPIVFRWDQFVTGGDQAVLRWDLRFALGDPLGLLWDQRFALGDPLALVWDVVGPVPKLVSLLWDDRALAFDTIALRWDQFVMGGDQFSLLWDLRFALGDTNTLRWDLRFALGDTNALRWDIFSRVTDQAALLWDIRVPVFDTTVFRWDILTRLGDTNALRWDIFTKLGDQTDLRWDLRFALADTVALLWDVFAAAIATQRGYRFRNDDGTETTATWITSQNLNISIGKETRFRIRMLTDFTNDPDPGALTLQYKKVSDPDTEWQTVEPV